MAAGSNGEDAMFGAPRGVVSNAPLFNILRAIPAGDNANHRLNPARTIYLDGPLARGAGARLHAGFGRPPGQSAGCFLAPWGRQYVIWIDANGDGRTSLQGCYKDAWPGTKTPVPTKRPATFVQDGTAAASRGKDGAWGRAVRGSTGGDRSLAGADDVVSWTWQDLQEDRPMSVNVRRP